MSSERYGDTDLVYWMGRSINAMTREELQVALGEAIMQIERLRFDKTRLICEKIMRDRNEVLQHRFMDDSYIASFC